MTKQSNTALALHFYDKFPHLFNKSSNPHNPKSFPVSLSSTREKVKEAFRILKLTENHTDLAGFKKLLFSLFADDYDGIGDSLFPSKNASVNHSNDDVKEMATEPTTTGGDTICSSGDESVRFYFGDNYVSRREFVEMRNEVFLNLWYSLFPRRVSKHGEEDEDDFLELWSTEEVLKEFEENHLL
nr:hypothetical protein Iba_chr11dCG8250 [Ipomoea batatas]